MIQDWFSDSAAQLQETGGYDEVPRGDGVPPHLRKRQAAILDSSTGKDGRQVQGGCTSAYRPVLETHEGSS